MRLKLTANSPFSFESVVKSHGWWQLAPFSYDEERKVLTYIAHLSSGRVLDISMNEISSGVSVKVDDSLKKDEKQEVKQMVTWMLGLKQDFSTFYTLVGKEPRLFRIVEQAKGRVLRSPTLFEDIIKTILTTNTLWAGTKRMVSNLVEQFGKSLNDGSGCAFPTASRLAKTTEKVLRTETRLGYRAPYVLDVARVFASSSTELEELKISNLATLDLRKKLLSLKGIGSYAAANLLIILGRYDFIPVDSWAKTVVSHEWYDGKSIGAMEIEAAFERWGEWKGLAYWFWDWSYFDKQG